MAWRVTVGNTATLIAGCIAGAPEFRVHVLNSDKELWLGGAAVTPSDGYLVEGKSRAGPFIVSSVRQLFGVRDTGDGEVSVIND